MRMISLQEFQKRFRVVWYVEKIRRLDMAPHEPWYKVYWGIAGECDEDGVECFQNRGDAIHHALALSADAMIKWKSWFGVALRGYYVRHFLWRIGLRLSSLPRAPFDDALPNKLWRDMELDSGAIRLAKRRIVNAMDDMRRFWDYLFIQNGAKPPQPPIPITEPPQYFNVMSSPVIGSKIYIIRCDLVGRSFTNKSLDFLFGSHRAHERIISVHTVKKIKTAIKTTVKTPLSEWCHRKADIIDTIYIEGLGYLALDTDDLNKDGSFKGTGANIKIFQDRERALAFLRDVSMTASARIAEALKIIADDVGNAALTWSQVCEIIGVSLGQLSRGLDAGETDLVQRLNSRAEKEKALLETVSRLLNLVDGDRGAARRWLNNPRIEWGGLMPVQALLQGKVYAVKALIDRACNGEISST